MLACLLTSAFRVCNFLCVQKGCTEAEAEALLRLAVQLAVEARDEAMAAMQASSTQPHDEVMNERRRLPRRRLLVAASVGCYGAALADGSEYRGDYGLTEEEIMAWHRPRLRILAQVRASLLCGRCSFVFFFFTPPIPKAIFPITN